MYYSRCVPPANDEPLSFREWANRMYHIIDHAGHNRRQTLSQVYKTMRNVYGINWEQVKKDYTKAHNGARANSTLELCYFLETEGASGEYGTEHFEHLLENQLHALTV